MSLTVAFVKLICWPFQSFSLLKWLFLFCILLRILSHTANCKICMLALVCKVLYSWAYKYYKISLEHFLFSNVKLPELFNRYKHSGNFYLFLKWDVIILPKAYLYSQYLSWELPLSLLSLLKKSNKKKKCSHSPDSTIFENQDQQ